MLNNGFIVIKRQLHNQEELNFQSQIYLIQF